MALPSRSGHHDLGIESRYGIWYLVLEHVGQGQGTSLDTSEAEEEEEIQEFRRLGIAYLDYEALPFIPAIELTAIRLV